MEGERVLRSFHSIKSPLKDFQLYQAKISWLSTGNSPCLKIAYVSFTVMVTRPCFFFEACQIDLHFGSLPVPAMYDIDELIYKITFPFSNKKKVAFKDRALQIKISQEKR